MKILLLLLLPVFCSAGNLEKMDISDVQENKTVKISPMRELAVSNPTRIVGATFVGTVLDPNFWTTTRVLTGTTVQIEGELSINAGTNANGLVAVLSKNPARYVAGTANFFRTVVRVPDSGYANSNRVWGVCDDLNAGSSPLNGYYFEVTDSTFGIQNTNTGVTVTISSNNFNVVPNYRLDTGVHIYEIWYTNSKAEFFIDDVMVHKISATNATSIDKLTLKACYLALNSGNTTSSPLQIRVGSIYSFGSVITQPSWMHISGTASGILKYSAGIVQKVIINQKGSAGGLFTIYDSTFASTSNIIADITTAASIGSQIYDLPFYNGLYYSQTGTSDVTLVYE